MVFGTRDLKYWLGPSEEDPTHEQMSMSSQVEAPCVKLREKPEGPSTQSLGSLVPDTIKSMVVGTRNLKYWVLGPSTSDLKFGLLHPTTTTLGTERRFGLESEPNSKGGPLGSACRFGRMSCGRGSSYRA